MTSRTKKVTDTHIKFLKFQRLDRVQSREPLSKQKKKRKYYVDSYVGRTQWQPARRSLRPRLSDWRGTRRHESFRSGGTQSRRVRQSDHAGRARNGVGGSHRFLRAVHGEIIVDAEAKISASSFLNL